MVRNRKLKPGEKMPKQRRSHPRLKRAAKTAAEIVAVGAMGAGLTYACVRAGNSPKGDPPVPKGMIERSHEPKQPQSPRRKRRQQKPREKAKAPEPPVHHEPAGPPKPPPGSGPPPISRARRGSTPAARRIVPRSGKSKKA